MIAESDLSSTDIPKVEDWTGWLRVAHHHRIDCDWVRSHANRIYPRGV